MVQITHKQVTEILQSIMQLYTLQIKPGYGW